MPKDNGMPFLDTAAQGDWGPHYTSDGDGSTYVVVQEDAAEGAGSLDQQLDAFLGGIDIEQVTHALLSVPAAVRLLPCLSHEHVCALWRDLLSGVLCMAILSL